METSKERPVANRLRNRNISKEDQPIAAKRRRTGNSDPRKFKTTV